MKPFPATGIEAFRREPRQYQALREITDAVNEGREALEKGTYAPAPQYGKWGSVWCPATGMRDGSAPPTWGPVAPGYLPTFGAGHFLSGVMEVPESFVTGGRLVPTVVFTFAGPTTAGDVVTWALLVTAANPNGEFTGTTIVSASYTNLAGDHLACRALRMPYTIPALEPLALVSYRIYRSGAGAAVDPTLLGVRWAYAKKKFGVEVEP